MTMITNEILQLREVLQEPLYDMNPQDVAALTKYAVTEDPHTRNLIYMTRLSGMVLPHRVAYAVSRAVRRDAAPSTSDQRPQPGRSLEEDYKKDVLVLSLTPKRA